MMDHGKRPREVSPEADRPPPHLRALLHDQGECLSNFLRLGLTCTNRICFQGYFSCHGGDGGSACAGRAMTPQTVGSSSSSSLSSSSDDQWEFHELIHAADKARQRYSYTTREVGQFELCLETVGVALATSKRETTAV